MKKFKKIFQEYETIELGNNLTVVIPISDNGEKIHPNGYNPYYQVFTNNLHIYQKRLSDEIGTRNAIKKEVDFVDAARLMFPSKKVHYRYWKAHLKKVGVMIIHCNHSITPFELKNVLFKLFQRNVETSTTKDINYLRLGLELDEVVEHCIYSFVDEKDIHTTKKIIFNPSKKLTGTERKSITAKLIRA